MQPLFTGAGLSISLSKDSPKEITLLESIACCAWEPQLVPWYFLFRILQCVPLIAFDAIDSIDSHTDSAYRGLVFVVLLTGFASRILVAPAPAFRRLRPPFVRQCPFDRRSSRSIQSTRSRSINKISLLIGFESTGKYIINFRYWI